MVRVLEDEVTCEKVNQEETVEDGVDEMNPEVDSKD